MVVSIARIDRRDDPVYKENRVQKPYKLYNALFIRKTGPKNHTGKTTRRPHDIKPTNTTNTHHLVRGRRPGVATRSTLALPEDDPVMVDGPYARAVFIQVATKTHLFRGRRPGVATRSTFALLEGNPVMVDETFCPRSLHPGRHEIPPFP